MFLIKKQKAFTLIELLVVIAIIGILATLAIVSLQQARQNARNAKRVADLRQIQTALELYFNENNSYPEEIEFQIGGQLISSSTAKILMNQIPSAPAVADGECLSSDYTYTVNEDNSSYKLTTCISKDINNLPAGIITATPYSLGYLDACNNQTEFTDSRDNTTYQIVAIGDQCWMAENLKYLPAVYPSAEGSNTAPYYYVYNYQGSDVIAAKATTYYNTHGVLYNWPATMAGDSGEVSQGICPEGWYVPTDNEWRILEGVVDSAYAVGDPVWTNTGWRGSDVGTKLKTSHLSNDSIGFSILLSGSRHTLGSFNYIGSTAGFWTSSNMGSGAWIRNLTTSNTSVYRGGNSFGSGFSVRCLKN